MSGGVVEVQVRLTASLLVMDTREGPPRNGQFGGGWRALNGLAKDDGKKVTSWVPLGLLRVP